MEILNFIDNKICDMIFEQLRAVARKHTAVVICSGIIALEIVLCALQTLAPPNFCHLDAFFLPLVPKSWNADGKKVLRTTGKPDVRSTVRLAHFRELRMTSAASISRPMSHSMEQDRYLSRMSRAPR